MPLLRRNNVRVTESTVAVFISYASQDAEAAKRICDALRAAGIEVWFDQSELRGGDAWDKKIRQQIRDCFLFMPLISQHSQERLEGYFRLEWKLAVDRSHRMAAERAFIMPVVVDSTREREALVPDAFRDVQWTHLRDGQTLPAFVERVDRLLTPDPSATPPSAERVFDACMTGPMSASYSSSSRRYNRALWAVAGALVVAVTYFAVDRFGLSKRTTAAVVTAPQPPTVVSEKSIAVLPFVDLSEKHDQEYFADGTAEEILNLLVKIPGLRVIGRTSSFSFKGKEADLPSIGRALGVTYLVEGSVRRSGDRIRVTAQLINARDGTHRWSDTFEGSAGDMLKLQDAIAVRIAHSLGLEVSSAPPAINSSAEAYDYYLRGRRELDQDSIDSVDGAREYFQKALSLSPQFAPAAVGIAEADSYKCFDELLPNVSCPKAIESVDAALKLDPRSADAYAIRAQLLIQYYWDWAGAAAAINKATELGGGLWTDFSAAKLAYSTGDMTQGRQILQRIIASNPFDADATMDMGYLVELRSGHFAEAELWIRRGLQISPKYASGQFWLGIALLMQGKFGDALAAMNRETIDGGQMEGLALVYTALNRKSDAEIALEAMRKDDGYLPFSFAEVHAFRGDADRAFIDLESAYRTHDPGLWMIKGDPLLRNLERVPRYKAFLRKMNLPE